MSFVNSLNFAPTRNPTPASTPGLDARNRLRSSVKPVGPFSSLVYSREWDPGRYLSRVDLKKKKVSDRVAVRTTRKDTGMGGVFENLLISSSSSVLAPTTCLNYIRHDTTMLSWLGRTDGPVSQTTQMRRRKHPRSSWLGVFFPRFQAPTSANVRGRLRSGISTRVLRVAVAALAEV